VRAEYLEMPGLVLTRWEMQRFWGLDPSVCDAVIAELTASGFLRCHPDSTYRRFIPRT
jgi:hypothetical protein